MKNDSITNLEKARKAAGLTRKSLEELSGVNFRTIEGYEQRKRSINRGEAALVNSLAVACGVNVADILEPEA